jgi:hypothetical protein
VVRWCNQKALKFFPSSRLISDGVGIPTETRVQMRASSHTGPFGLFPARRGRRPPRGPKPSGSRSARREEQGWACSAAYGSGEARCCLHPARGEEPAMVPRPGRPMGRPARIAPSADGTRNLLHDRDAELSGTGLPDGGRPVAPTGCHRRVARLALREPVVTGRRIAPGRFREQQAR